MNHMKQVPRIRMISFQTEVVQQQRTTAAILIRCGQESGALQWTQVWFGNHVTFQSVVSIFLHAARTCSSVFIIPLNYGQSLTQPGLIRAKVEINFTFVVLQ